MAYTKAEQRAINNHPDLPEDVAAAFADDLNDVADEMDAHTMMTDIQIVTVALGNMVAQFEAVTKDDLVDDEDAAVVAYCKRVLAAAEAGDLTPIRRELAEDDARESAASTGDK